MSSMTEKFCDPKVPDTILVTLNESESAMNGDSSSDQAFHGRPNPADIYRMAVNRTDQMRPAPSPPNRPMVSQVWNAWFASKHANTTAGRRGALHEAVEALLLVNDAATRRQLLMEQFDDSTLTLQREFQSVLASRLDAQHLLKIWEERIGEPLHRSDMFANDASLNQRKLAQNRSTIVAVISSLAVTCIGLLITVIVLTPPRPDPTSGPVVSPTQTHQSGPDVIGNSGGVIVGDANRIYKSETSKSPAIPTTNSAAVGQKDLPGSGASISHNTGPVIYGNQNEIHQKSDMESQIDQLKNRWRGLKDQVRSISNQRSKRTLQERIDTIDSEISNPATSLDVTECNQQLDYVEAKLEYMRQGRANFERAERLLASIDSDEARALLFAIQCQNHEFANAMKTAAAMTGSSIHARMTRVRALVVQIEVTRDELPMSVLSSQIVECENIGRILNKTSGVDAQFDLLDLTNDELIQAQHWLDQASSKNSIASNEFPFKTSTERGEAICRMADFVSELGRRIKSITANVSSAGEVVSKGAAIGSMVNQSQASHTAYLALLSLDPTPTEMIDHWRDAADRDDNELASLLKSEILISGNAAAMEHLLSRFQIAARSFERGELQRAIEQIDPLKAELDDPAIFTKTPPSIREKTIVGWAAIHLADVLNRDPKEVRGNELFERLSQYTGTLFEQHAMEYVIPFHKDTCKGLILLASQAKESDVVETLLGKIGKLINSNSDRKQLKFQLREYLNDLRSKQMELTEVVASRLDQLTN